VFFLGANQGVKTNSEQLISTAQCTFLEILRRYGNFFVPLNSLKIKRSRALELSNQAINGDFHESKFLIPVANASMGDM